MGSEIPSVSNGCASEKTVIRRTYQVVVAATREGGLGKDGKMAWHIPTDTKFYHDVTTITSNPEKMNAVIMGRISWDSIPPEDRPFCGRLNVIVTRSPNFDIGGLENVLVCGSLNSALEMLASPPYDDLIETVFNTGGGILLRDTLNAPACDAIHITEMETSIECDTFIPSIDMSLFHPWYSSFPLVENNIRYSFVTYVRVRSNAAENGTLNNCCKFCFLPQMIRDRHEEFVYQRLVQNIFLSDNFNDRTRNGTLSKFGCQMRFNLRKTFPLLRTKTVFWQGVVEELLWYISGSDYTGQGIDQLSDVIHKIKNSPDDRRIVLSSWNPSHHKQTVVCPNHMFAQFYVANGELSCLMYQPSADMGLGVPFDIASYALLTCLIAHVCDLLPGDFIHDIGVAHVDRNHFEPFQDQLRNMPKPFPVLKINSQKKSIDSFVSADFNFIGYPPHEQIKMKMAV
ncbi:hypothetical protein KSS87_009412 [Heliosperma pusillum]|nr:hypothetical protein KSS87_009412 [Heliosperma pusillum]